MTEGKDIYVYRFERGNQGELGPVGVIRREVEQVTLTETVMSGCVTRPVSTRVQPCIKLYDQRRELWPVKRKGGLYRVTLASTDELPADLRAATATCPTCGRER